MKGDLIMSTVAVKTTSEKTVTLDERAVAEFKAAVAPVVAASVSDGLRPLFDEMQAMLDSTLAFARDDAADEPRVQTDIAALVRNVCNDLADAGQRVGYDGPDRLSFACAPGAIKRAVQNVAVNAVKYAGEALVSLSQGEDGIDITIADRGPGIPADRREDVFRPFFRLESSRSRETGGSGLGLAVARSIVRRHGGDIHVDDREGGGALIRMTLPHSPISGAHTPASGVGGR